MGLQGLLHLQHRRYARRRGGEHREKGVPLRIDLPAAVTGKPRPDDRVVVGQHAGVHVLAHPTEQNCRALDIGEKKRERPHTHSVEGSQPPQPIVHRGTALCTRAGVVFFGPGFPAALAVAAVLGVAVVYSALRTPVAPGSDGRRVLATGRPDAVEFQKYDVEIPGSPGQFARRYWSVVNAPVLGPDGQVVLIAHCLEEVTERMRRFMSALAADAEHEGPD